MNRDCAVRKNLLETLQFFCLQIKLKNNVCAVPKNIRNLGGCLFFCLANGRLQYFVVPPKLYSEVPVDELMVERKFHISRNMFCYSNMSNVHHKKMSGLRYLLCSSLAASSY